MTTYHSNQVYRNDTPRFLALLAKVRQEIKDAKLTVAEGHNTRLLNPYVIYSEERWPGTRSPKIQHWFEFPFDAPFTDDQANQILATIKEHRDTPAHLLPQPAMRYAFTTTGAIP